MTISKEAQYLLDRYILAFSRRLPFSSRKDIVNELRSSVLDALEETVGDNEVREEHMRSVLEELGAPGRLAGSYTTEQFIIGPDIFPLFKLVLTIVAIVVAVTSMIQIGISLSSWDIPEILLQIAKLITSLVTALGFLIIVFFLIQRFSKEMDWRSEWYGDWSVDDLPEISSRTPVKRWEQILNIIFTLILILGLNLFGDRIGARYSADGACFFVPTLREGFYTLLPFLTLRWALSIVLALILIIHREERFGTSVFIIVLSCIDISIAALFLQKGLQTFFNIDALLTTPLESAVPIFRILFYAVFIMIIVLTVFDIIKKIIELFRYPSAC